MARNLHFCWWGGEDLNLRPTDYEFDPGEFLACRSGDDIASD